MSDLYKAFIEFLGTLIALEIILIGLNKLPMQYIALVVGAAFLITVALFYKISANFNPAVTLMLVLAKKQKGSTLIPFWIAQLLGAVAAYLLYGCCFKFL